MPNCLVVRKNFLFFLFFKAQINYSVVLKIFVGKKAKTKDIPKLFVAFSFLQKYLIAVMVMHVNLIRKGMADLLYMPLFVHDNV